eukprot:TRINITY_DN39493_c0_g1_i1.p2 TRINITY_DN39493_c0_g1~~TRINITY_DN39493_c0_g1_i1.p2  ORF type:complete len:102 (-),score=6.48 TRINITY_DN39493_c0_g1_i1:7-312(-)
MYIKAVSGMFRQLMVICSFRNIWFVQCSVDADILVGSPCQRAVQSARLYHFFYCGGNNLPGTAHVFTGGAPVSYTHLRAHETGRNLVCRLLLEKKKTNPHA